MQINKEGKNKNNTKYIMQYNKRYLFIIKLYFVYLNNVWHVIIVNNIREVTEKSIQIFVFILLLQFKTVVLHLKI